MTKNQVDINDDILGAAPAELDTSALKDTVNEAVRPAALPRDRSVSIALDTIANAKPDGREEAWR